jgi:hypothetical protein
MSDAQVLTCSQCGAYLLDEDVSDDVPICFDCVRNEQRVESERASLDEKTKVFERAIRL